MSEGWGYRGARHQTSPMYRLDRELNTLVGLTMYGGTTWLFRTRHLHARRALWAIFRQTQAMRTRPPEAPRIFFDL